MTDDLAGKVILVTGGTEGIGRQASLELARRGATLVLVARSREKGERVRAELAAASGNPNLSLLVGDMARPADVRRVASEFKATHDRLDVLVNNAGALFQKHELTPDGFEMTFALNHLGYHLLTTQLEDVLAKTPGARVVSTSSGAHNGGRIRLDSIAKRPSGKAGFPAYCDSKLANILFTRELARRLADKGVVANCFHPGFVRSRFALDNGGFTAFTVKLAAALFGRTVEKGAETLVWLATAPEAGRVSGEYFQDKKPAKASARARDDEMAKQLWDHTESLLATA